MAVGAPGSAILAQFLIEAVGFSLAGGAIGIVLATRAPMSFQLWRIGQR